MTNVNTLKRPEDLVRDPDTLRAPLKEGEKTAGRQLSIAEVNAAPARYIQDRKKRESKRGQTPAKDERVRAALEMRIRGAKTKDVAEAFGVSEVTIRNWTREGIAKGMAEAIREQIAEKLLPKAAATYEDILNTPASVLAEAHKGHEVKLKAARDIAKGLGVLRPESQVTQRRTNVTMSLDDYLVARASREANTVEGEVIESDAPEQALE